MVDIDIRCIIMCILARCREYWGSLISNGTEADLFQAGLKTSRGSRMYSKSDKINLKWQSRKMCIYAFPCKEYT